MWINRLLELPPAARGRRAGRMLRGRGPQASPAQPSMRPGPRRAEACADPTFDVGPHQIWRAGRHILACGDLAEGDGLALLDICRRPVDIAYAAPAWLLERPKGVWPDLDLVLGLACTIRHARAPLALIASATDLDVVLGLVQMFGAHDLCLAARWTLKRPRLDSDALRHASLHLFIGPAAAAENVRRAPTFVGLDADHAVAAVLAHYTEPGAVVFDPCLGTGATAVAAELAGRACLGMEADPRQLSAILSSLVVAGVPREEIRSVRDVVTVGPTLGEGQRSFQHG